MFLRAPDATEPFRGRDLILWSRSQCWIPWDPRGTITDSPGAGQIPIGAQVWPSAPTLATAWTPYSKTGASNPFAPLWGLAGLGLGALDPGDISTIVSTALPAIAREVDAVARRAVEKAMTELVLPPVLLAGTLAVVALVVATGAYRKKNPSRRRRARRRFVLHRRYR